jgi:plasmid stability protein
MATVTVRGLDDGVKERLQVRAAQNSRSMEAEVRAILADALASPSAVERHVAGVVAAASGDQDWVARARAALAEAWEQPDWQDDWLPPRDGGSRPTADLG